MILPYDSYVDSIEEDAERLLELAEQSLRVPVRTCPGWDLEALLEHVAAGYRTWCARLTAAPTEEDPARHDRPESTRPEGSVAQVLATSLDAVVEALRGRDPAAYCWSPVEEDRTVRFAARRLAQETSLHRVDAELARQGARPVERELAADGIDERISVLLRHELDSSDDSISLGGSICLICTDDPTAFVLDVEAGRFRLRSGRGPADCVVVGSASDLFLFCWNRPVSHRLEVTGSPIPVESWAMLPS